MSRNSNVGRSVTLVTEAYNLSEGQSEQAFVRAVREIGRLAKNSPGMETLVTDPSLDGIATSLVVDEFPNVRVLHLPGQSYDRQKNSVAAVARGEIMVFLDGDCHPESEAWLDAILSPFADEAVAAVAGLTLYDDVSVTGIAMSILDFGFLFGTEGTIPGCYASNNVAFRRTAFLKTPIPESELMRCCCFKHAQDLTRSGVPIWLQPSALVAHELPDVRTERLRRGYDHVAALWVDPLLAETEWLDFDNEVLVRHIIEQNFALASQRLNGAPPALRITSANRESVVREIKDLMQIDAVGIRQALSFGEAQGLNRRALDLHRRGKNDGRNNRNAQ